MQQKEKDLRNAAAEGNIETVSRLFDENVNINAQGPGTKRTALHWAIKNRHYDIAIFLLKKGACSTIEDKDGKTPLNLYCSVVHKNVSSTIKRFLFKAPETLFDYLVQSALHEHLKNNNSTKYFVVDDQGNTSFSNDPLMLNPQVTKHFLYT